MKKNEYMERNIAFLDEIGYGKQGAGRNIPGHSTLIFEIELISIA
ncbi:MAG: FKBP-type peptidyl-prolyl cis-trans isomerase [Bacteroidales bacterium]|nr:FKBP-type peptidyl-prolyl cis-trans isomerase [Bacteroidales bacterium]